MEKNNAFKKGLKVPYTQEKRYNTEKICLRKDKDTGEIGMYLVEYIMPVANEERTSLYRATNIFEPNNSIDYKFKVSPLAIHSERIYNSAEEERRYGKIYSLYTVLRQLTGKLLEPGEYTVSELKDYLKQINDEKEKARHCIVYSIQYSDKYKGKRLLEGLHLATPYVWFNISKKEDVECIEDESVSVQRSKNDRLIITRNGEKESVSKKYYDSQSVNLFALTRCMCESDIGGYTIEALRKIFEEREAEKKRKEGQEIDE